MKTNMNKPITWIKNLFVPSPTRLKVVRVMSSQDAAPPWEKQLLIKQVYLFNKWRNKATIDEEYVPLYVIAARAMSGTEWKSKFYPFDENGILPPDHPNYPVDHEAFYPVGGYK